MKGGDILDLKNGRRNLREEEVDLEKGGMTPLTYYCEWQRIWVIENFRIQIQKDGPNNSAILQNWFALRSQVPHL